MYPQDTPEIDKYPAILGSAQGNIRFIQHRLTSCYDIDQQIPLDEMPYLVATLNEVYNDLETVFNIVQKHRYHTLVESDK